MVRFGASWPDDDSPVEEEVQPAEDLSEAHAAELENENSSALLFRSPPVKSVAMMPELLH